MVQRIFSNFPELFHCFCVKCFRAWQCAFFSTSTFIQTFVSIVPFSFWGHFWMGVGWITFKSLWGQDGFFLSSLPACPFYGLTSGVGRTHLVFSCCSRIVLPLLLVNTYWIFVVFPFIPRSFRCTMTFLCFLCIGLSFSFFPCTGLDNAQVK